MKRLKEASIPAHVYAVSLYSDADHICPGEICKLDTKPGATNIINVPLEDKNHLDFMVDEDIYDIVRRHLEIGFSRAHERESAPDKTP